MQPGSLATFILLLFITTSCRNKETQFYPVPMDSINLIAPEKPQPIAAKSQTGSLSGLNRTGKYLRTRLYIHNQPDVCHPG